MSDLGEEFSDVRAVFRGHGKFLYLAPFLCLPSCSLSVADCTQGLQIVQRALAPPTVHRPNVVHLPELPFTGVADEFVKLVYWQLCHPGALEQHLPLAPGCVPHTQVQLVHI